jgi:hypothetical protein
VEYFGRDIPMIALSHTAPFFVKVADALFERLVAEHIVFILLEEAASDPAYEQVGKVASGKFLVDRQKLADAPVARSRLLRPRSAKCMRKCFRRPPGLFDDVAARGDIPRSPL